MKRVLSILLLSCAVISAYADGDVIEIWTASDLSALRDNVNAGTDTYAGKTVRLMADIDLGGTISERIDWEPIGKSETRWDEEKQAPIKDDSRLFKGLFDGQGYTITMCVTCNRVVGGLFGYLYGEVRHLKVVGAISNSYQIENITYTSSTAGIAAYNRGTIRECANLASIVGVHAGGIAGENHGIIINCYNQGSIGADATFTGEKFLGGIAGANDGTDATISYVYASCSMENVSSTGGIVANPSTWASSTCFYNVKLNGSTEMTGSTTLTGTVLLGKLNSIGDNTWTFTDGELPELTCFKNKIVRLSNTRNNNAILSNYKGQICSVELNGRTLYKDGAWNTICLPFELSTSQVSTLLGSNGYLMELDVDGEYVNEDGTSKTGFNPVDGTLNLYFKNATSIKAGKPYIIKWECGDDIDNPVFSGVIVTNAPATGVNYDTTTGNYVVTASNSGYYPIQFIGNYNPVILTGGNPSNLYLGTAIEGDEKYSTLYYPQTNKTMYSCRAYFHVDLSNTSESTEPNEIRAFNLHFEDEEGLTEVKAVRDVHEVNGDTWYTSFGMKLEEKPSVPGVYIYNGRKVMIQ